MTQRVGGVVLHTSHHILGHLLQPLSRSVKYQSGIVHWKRHPPCFLTLCRQSLHPASTSLNSSQSGMKWAYLRVSPARIIFNNSHFSKHVCELHRAATMLLCVA